MSLLNVCADEKNSEPERKCDLKFVALVLVISLMNAAIYNIPFFSFAFENIDYTSVNGVQTLCLLFLISFFTSVITLLFINALSISLFKVFVVLIIILNACALYFILAYGVILEKTMIGNIFNTNFDESSEYMSIKLIMFIVFLGLLPAVLFLRMKIRALNRLKSLILGLLSIALFYMLAVALSHTWLWVDKNAKVLGGLILPWSYIVNTSLFISEQKEKYEYQEVLPNATHLDNKKTVVILVIGETARSKNFNLYGYDRITNPLLSDSNVAVMNDPQSCETYTTGSLKCMLSHKKNSQVFSNAFEPLPSYLNRHDVEVIWRANNWGEPKIQVSEYQDASQLRPLCKREDCQYDGVLLSGLKDRIKASSSNKIFIVLHQKGSHGPAYNTRYPKAFEQFKPVCESVELNNCTSQALINAYDNTILYTDYFLHETIGILNQLNDVASMMMYISDHGESLGEHGKYLHGTPNMIAPREQKEIPFLIWMSDAFKNMKDVTLESLESREHNSHANVFHSILGAFRLRSEIYQGPLDVFSANTEHGG